MVSELQPPASDKHVLVEIEDACRIIRKAHSRQTNLTNSKYPVWLHKESAGEVPHLYAAVCRLDEDGNINNDHNIHLRTQRAAERVAKKRGYAKMQNIVYLPITKWIFLSNEVRRTDTENLSGSLRECKPFITNDMHKLAVVFSATLLCNFVSQIESK